MSKRWRHAPAGSRRGKFGADDQLGRMNLVDRPKVLEGIAEIREGRTFCLSLPLDLPGGGNALNPRRQPPKRHIVVRDGKSAGQQGFCWSYADEDKRQHVVVNDDIVLMTLQYATQWDSLAHFETRFNADGDSVDEMVFYNGFRGGTEIVAAQENPNVPVPWAHFPDPAAHALGIENLASHGVQGRGVMLDLEHHVGRTRQAVGCDALMRLMQADEVEVEAGDMVCVHTGFAQMLVEMTGRPDVAALHASGLNGRDARLLNWITDSNLACLLADDATVVPDAMLATEAVAASPADGYTLLVAASNHAMIPALYAGRIKFDALGSFKPVCTFASSATVLVFGLSLPMKTVAEFLAAAGSSLPRSPTPCRRLNGGLLRQVGHRARAAAGSGARTRQRLRHALRRTTEARDAGHCPTRA